MLFDDPGLGKSAQALTAHIESNRPGCVIVAPKVAIGVWEHEASLWAPGFAVRVQDSREAVTAPAAGEILVTSYERASVDGRFGTLILDEAHMVKNPKAQRFRRCEKLARQAGQAIALTGTPIQRDPMDLWGILGLLDLQRSSYVTKSNFVSLFGGVSANPGIEWTRPTAKAYAPIQHWMLRRERESVLDLPPRVHEDIWVDLPKRAATRYAEIAERYPADDERWEEWATGGELAAALADLSSVKAASALQAMDDFNPSTKDPLVVFTAHRQAAQLIAAARGWPLICGATDDRERTKIARKFQDGAYPGMVATIQAAGVALTLTRAATALFVSRTFIPALNSQAEDRLYRIGQVRNVRVVYCRSKSPLEFAIDRVLKRKAPYV